MRPSYAECRRAIREYMPELVPSWERAIEIAGDGDLEARFLSIFSPPAYLTGSSPGQTACEEPMLVRNYDCSPKAFGGVALRTDWQERAVMGTSDCLIGLVDGVNDAGLAVSLTFGRRRAVGAGFGVPIILRYILQTCETAEEAGRRLSRLPAHMSYNVTVPDAGHKRVTVYLAGSRACHHQCRRCQQSPGTGGMGGPCPRVA